MSTFETLPNEILCCIIQYLDPAECFRILFTMNYRLRKLVKCYVRYSRVELERDIKRFSSLHSWYKHLSFKNDGDIFYILPRKGQQLRYGFDPCVSDYNGIHWRFLDDTVSCVSDKRIAGIIYKYPVKLNPLFYPEIKPWVRNISDFRDFMCRWYPSESELLKYDEDLVLKLRYASPNITDEVTLTTIRLIHKKEQIRLYNLIKDSANHIWREIQKLEDVNVLEIT